MKLSAFSPVILAALLPALASAQGAPNLSGTWTLNIGKSAATGGGTGQREANGGGRGGGLGLGPAADQLTIVHGTKSIMLTERRGAAESTVELRLDSQTQPRTFASGRSAGMTASSVTSIKDGRVLTTVTLPAAPGGGTATTYSEIRYLDSDGSLVLEIAMAGSANSRRSVYTKK